LNIGFIYYNFNPASIYLGDSGSLFQGFLISIIIINMDWEFENVSLKLFAPVLLLGYTILDTTYITISRLKNGFKPWIGDTNHTTHKLVKLGLSIRVASLLVYLLTTFLCFSGISIYFLGSIYAAPIILLNLVVISFYVFRLNRMEFESHVY